jgi:hypothetical protein
MADGEPPVRRAGWLRGCSIHGSRFRNGRAQRSVIAKVIVVGLAVPVADVRGLEGAKFERRHHASIITGTSIRGARLPAPRS